ncbi:unnamed protein product, partial [Symbiodinium sp. KB8]
AAGGAKGGKGGRAAGAAKDKKKDAKGKGKGKGDNKGKTAGAAGAAQYPPIKPGSRSALTPEQKAKTPCIFHPHGTCRMAASCPFLHETVINNKTGKGAGKAPGGVAAVLGLSAAVPATIAVVIEAARRNLVPASAGRPRSRRTLAWIEDSGAGRNLASVRALVEQGFARSEVEGLLRKTKDPVDFETGGGTQPSARTIGIAPVASNCSSSTYMLPDCPVVRSMGLTVLEEQRAFIWDPRTSKPYYALDLSKLQIICPESNRYYAHEVRENVPHFRSQVVLTPGLPATRTRAPSPDPQDDGLGLLPEGADQGGLLPDGADTNEEEGPPAGAPEESDEGEELLVEVANSDTEDDAEDAWTGAGRMFPAKTKETPDVIRSLREFGGRKAGTFMVRAASDRAPELIAACEQLGWIHEKSTPNTLLHNAVAERGIRTAKEGSSCLLLQAGFPHKDWPEAINYFDL